MGRQCVELGGCMSQQFYTMKELPVSERPYEKAKEQGVTALSDAELLAVLLKTGTHEKNSVELAREVLALHPVHKGLLGLYYLTDKPFSCNAWLSCQNGLPDSGNRSAHGLIRRSISQDTSWKRCELWKPNRQECCIWTTAAV